MHRLRSFFDQLIPVIFALGILVSMSGCLGGASKPPRTFLLSSPGVALHLEAGRPEGSRGQLGPSVGVGPVKIPEYLNRPQILLRTRGNEIEIQEFHRWAEPLKDGLSRVLAENLSRLLDSDRTPVFPWRGSMKPDYQITVEVLRFDGGLGGEVSLEVLWALSDARRDVLLESRRSSFTGHCDGSGYEELVDAHNVLVWRLSREIAEAVASHPLPPQS